MQDMIGNTWLEFNFGWKPLVTDLDDASSYLTRFLADSKSQSFRTVSATGEDAKAKDFVLTSAVTDGLYASADAYGKRTRKFTVRYLACIGVEPASRKNVIQEIGLNLSSFIPTLWELIPYSFAVDYFTNVGEMVTGLANLSTNHRWTMYWIIDEDETEIKTLKLVQIEEAPYIIDRSCSPGFYKRVKKSIYRDRFLDSLIPDFRFEIPGLTSMKWVNLAALAGQLATTRLVTNTFRR